MKKTAPILLSGEVTLNAGQTMNAPSQNLMSPFREPIWIDAITWTIWNPAVNANNAFWDWGGTIRTRLTLGRTEITRNRFNGFVPIWNLSPQVNDLSASVQFDRFSTSDPVASTMHKWKLPRPLYIPPGMSLQSTFMRTQDAGPAGTVVSVGYAGRYADPSLPTLHEIDVPFATFAEAAATASYFQSDENDFVNPFLVPLNTQRFILRAQHPQTAPDYLTEGYALTSLFGVKVQDSFGHNMVRDFVDGSSRVIFDYLRRAWTFKNILNSKERYNVQIRPYQGTAGGAAVATFTDAPMLSLIGWRKEEF
jgi:hypothetical protein